MRLAFPGALPQEEGNFPRKHAEGVQRFCQPFRLERMRLAFPGATPQEEGNFPRKHAEGVQRFCQPFRLERMRLAFPGALPQAISFLPFRQTCRRPCILLTTIIRLQGKQVGRKRPKTKRTSASSVFGELSLRRAQTSASSVEPSSRRAAAWLPHST